MIERNEFRIRFGRMKEALALWKEITNEFKANKSDIEVRIMTDLTGPAYTLILELKLRDFAHMSAKNEQWGAMPKASELYQQFVPLCESSVRTLYKVEFDN